MYLHDHVEQRAIIILATLVHNHYNPRVGKFHPKEAVLNLLPKGAAYARMAPYEYKDDDPRCHRYLYAQVL